EEIDRCEEEAENTEERLYAEDTDCQAAGTPLTELDLYVSTVVPFESGLQSQQGFSGGWRAGATADHGSKEAEPDCTRYMSLDFSMHAFEHLMGIRQRANLTMVPETGLHKAISGGAEGDVEDIEYFGRHINHLLNSDANWTAFNLAALYWREKGSAPAAVECLRRALHVSPHEVKDVALISLANVLHRARMSDEAAIVVHAAIDIAPDNAICHFTLGNIYAVLAEYNKSEICYENMLRLQPEFRSARQRLHAVRCHSKVEAALEKQHRELQKVLQKLKEYQHRKELYVKLMGQLVDEAVLPHGWDDADCTGQGVYESGSSTTGADGRASSNAPGQPNGSARTADSSAPANDNDGPSRSPPGYCSGSVDEPPGFPFYDNMIDLQFNVRPEESDRARQSCDDKTMHQS
ncbi:tetratricopeptide repeat protein 17-like, partial [Tropilaelaps mercedesae]